MKPKNIPDATQLALRTLEKIPVMVFWVREDGSFIYGNRTAYESMGYTEEEFYELRSHQTMADYNVEHRDRFRRELKQHGFVSFETNVRRKDGSTFPVISHHEIMMISGEPVNCGYSIDITGRVMLEERIREDRERHSRELAAAQAAQPVSSRAQLIGRTRVLRELKQKAKRYAASNKAVLIHGETGTGKELLANYVHEHSKRKDKELVVVNCSTLTDSDLNSTLFGHLKGAYTSSVGARDGLFRTADGSTLYLDEVGELNLNAQAQLLRVLQEKTVRPMGSDQDIPVDVRIIAATNRDLQKMVGEGSFREDLYYRISTLELNVPPLRDRRDDIDLLLEFFLARLNREEGTDVQAPGGSDLTRLRKYPFPGNIRQLMNVIDRAYWSREENQLSFPEDQMGSLPTDLPSPTGFLTRDEMERQYIIHVLKHCKFRNAGPGGAAEILGMHPDTLRSRMRKLGINRWEIQHDA